MKVMNSRTIAFMSDILFRVSMVFKDSVATGSDRYCTNLWYGGFLNFFFLKGVASVTFLGIDDAQEDHVTHDMLNV